MGGGQGRPEARLVAATSPGPESGPTELPPPQPGPLDFPAASGASWGTHKSPPPIWRDLSPVSAKPTKLPFPFLKSVPLFAALVLVRETHVTPREKHLAIRMKKKISPHPRRKVVY